MNKARALLFVVLLAFAASVNVFAGAFSDYYDYMNNDGTYSYYFTQGLKVTLNEEWYQNTFVSAEDYGAVFYHKDSYDRYAEEGFKAGRLFTIGASVNTSFEQLPSFVYIGFDEETAMNYYAELPTDYQAYPKDPAVKAEYDALWATVRDVIAGIEILSDTKNDSVSGGNTLADSGDDMVPGGNTLADSGNDMVPGKNAMPLLGGWEAAADPTVSDDLKMILSEATRYQTDAVFEPVALLATQIVSGTNYCVLCKMVPVLPDAKPAYVNVYLYVDLSGNASILEIQDINIGLN